MNINYHSFLPHLGYGVAAKEYIKLIKEKETHQVNWAIHKFEDNVTEHLFTEFSTPSDLNFIHLTPNFIDRLFTKHCPNIANTVFESTQLPAEWKSNLEMVDRIAVPCNWNAQVFEESLKRPIYLLPHLSQFSGQSPVLAENTLNLPDDQFIFLTVGTWELRKNLEQLINAFCRAFTKKDRVLLVVKTSDNDLNRLRYSWRKRVSYLQKTTKTLQQLLRFKRNAPNIRLIPTILTDEEMQQLYYRCHAYITLTHGEGWGLGAYEAAWFGKPVIATGFGGYLDFLKSDNSFLTPYKLIRYKKNFWDHGDRSTHYYAQPDVDSAIDYLHFVYRSYPESLQRGQRLSDYVHTHFSRQKIADQLSTFLAI